MLLNPNLAHALPSACSTMQLPDWIYDPQTFVWEAPTAAVMMLSPSASSDQTLVRDMPLEPIMLCQSGDRPNVMLSLTIVGDLNAICDGWSSHEIDNARRLVEFERSQTGSTIAATFKAITQDEYSPNKTCISCWVRNAEYYVSSVDIIGMTEALRAACYTAEEKEVIYQTPECFIPWVSLGNVLKMIIEGVSNTGYNGV